jgi:phosphotransferase system enzyme I (PtsP)
MPGAPNIGGSRVLLRKLREIMEAGGEAQQRLDRLVTMIASTMVADVCSIYLTRGAVHELFATQGLDPGAVHNTRLKVGEGLVGLVAESAQPLNIADAPHHERFSYRPETGEDPFNAFLGVPIVRSERTFGVLVVQNRVQREYGDEEVEALQTIAMVLAEMVAAGAFGELSGLAEVEARPSRPELLTGRSFSEGLAIGKVVLHEPHAPLGRVIADDPAKEEQRLDAALTQVRLSLAGMIEGDAGRLFGASRDVIETFAMLAADATWELKLKQGVRAGLSAEAAVERVRGEHRAKFNAARDAYLRERLHDLEDLDNRLLRTLAGAENFSSLALPADAILVARDLGPAELLDYGAERLKGVVLEGGGGASHAVIVARALGVPMVGQVHGLLSRVEAGDSIILDGERGEVRLRPESPVTQTYQQRLNLRSALAKEFAKLRDQPAITRDGQRVTLLLNAGLALDAHHLDDSGAEGIGLFRTEFQFMVSETLPRLESQTLLYRDVLEAAGERPVTFRTLDVGGDKVLPYVVAEREENPALGWRALRIGLDRPGLLRYQLRALVNASGGRLLRIMFPLVTTVAEFDAARALVDRELEWAHARGKLLPRALQVGAMVEAPALALCIPDLKGRADFISVGTNDLMQYFFAADRGNPRVADRYDILSAPALRLLDRIRQDAERAALPVSICGEAAGRHLEALAFVALGFRRLSMPASGVGPIKSLILKLEVSRAEKFVQEMIAADIAAPRAELLSFARSQGWVQ